MRGDVLGKPCGTLHLLAVPIEAPTCNTTSVNIRIPEWDPAEISPAEKSSRTAIMGRSGASLGTNKVGSIMNTPISLHNVDESTLSASKKYSCAYSGAPCTMPSGWRPPSWVAKLCPRIRDAVVRAKSSACLLLPPSPQPII
jgi:hypothetical protein